MNNIYKEATVRLVFDRYKTASKTKKGTVQLEITFMRKRKWISTGVRLFKDQWNDRKHVVNSTNMIELNDFLNKTVTDTEAWLRDNSPFSWEKFEAYLKAPRKSDSFRDFVLDTINGRNDIRDSTKVAADAGIDKPLSSHWGRRTAAVMFANHHVPYEIVAKILGHGNVSATAEF